MKIIAIIPARGGSKRFPGKNIANLTAFLCSDLNQSITGQLIAVDGGFTCK